MQLATLPIQIILAENGMIGFQSLGDFSIIIDCNDSGIQAIVSTQDIFIGANTVIDYGVLYPYKEMPELLAWVQDKKLIEPTLQRVF